MAILPFQSTRPLRGATCALTRDATSWKNFNPRAPCGARLGGGIRITFSALNFNPRAPCGARLQTMTMTACRLIISTHAPLAGRDVGQTYRIALSTIFQPTRPLRGATFMVGDVFSSMIFQPTRPLRGATNGRVILEKKGEEFQPTRPLRGATWLLVLILCFLLYFNPRAPCGARQQKCTNHYAHFCDNRQISDVFAQNAACQGILFLFDAGKPCGFWVRTAQVISARLCFAL